MMLCILNVFKLLIYDVNIKYENSTKYSKYITTEIMNITYIGIYILE